MYPAVHTYMLRPEKFPSNIRNKKKLRAMPPCLLCCRRVRRISVLSAVCLCHTEVGLVTLFKYAAVVSQLRVGVNEERQGHFHVYRCSSRGRDDELKLAIFFLEYKYAGMSYMTRVYTCGMCSLGTLWRGPQHTISEHTILTAAVEGSFAAARCAGFAKKASGRRSVGSPLYARAIAEACVPVALWGGTCQITTRA